ncbi:MAG UNVERIFIED_CONTAM: hypothetical protein LVR18_52200 [Planctomycetaceae bacterium]
MIKSMQQRLQFWYGSVLTLTLLLFGSMVYWRRSRFARTLRTAGGNCRRIPRS